MNDSGVKNSQGANSAPTPQATGFSPWQALKGKRISYLTLPLLIMATVTEFVILATGWRYQQVVCLPKGMGVTFFGIGPIGATILAVELLKLPLAIWTASRAGKQKVFMLFVGLPLICVLTFQLVKDMAVYEMGVAMQPANEMLAKAADEETKIALLNGELNAIEGKKKDRESKLTELTAQQAKAKADLEELRKRNDDVRQDAISLTDFQKKELADVSARQQAIVQQFNSDVDQLNRSLADLRARRETELARASKWNAEEARIENEYKAKLSEYTNKKTAYDKAKAEYDNANFIKRQMLKEPIDPGVAPVREANTLLKPTIIADLEAQIKSKEAELTSVNNKRRESLAQVDADAQRIRNEFDQRSGTKREQADKKREELLAAEAALSAEMKTEQKQLDQELAPAVQKIDGIRAELDASRKRAESYYEAREASIRQTQVHRIATTVEIVRGLIMGERPMSVKATAKERGDILTDQISMVRIWVYPVLAFIVAFLPTLMVEIGFSTVFHPEQKRPQYRIGFLGRRLHELYIRAGKQKIFRAERLASEATAKVAARDRQLAQQKSVFEQAMANKDAEFQAANDALAVAKTTHEEQFNQLDAEHSERLRTREEALTMKLAVVTESYNRVVAEKDELQEQQRAELDRQIQSRESAWNERLSKLQKDWVDKRAELDRQLQARDAGWNERVTKLQKDWDDQRAASEAERTATLHEHQNRLKAVTDDCKNQIIQFRRQMADAELAAADKVAKLEHELKDLSATREGLEAQLKHQSEAHSLGLSKAREESAREIEKAARGEKQRQERQKLEFDKTLRQREEAFEHRLKQRETELTIAFEAQLTEERNKAEQEKRFQEMERERLIEARAREVDAQWSQSVQQREDTAQTMYRQREQQFQAQADARLRAIQAKSEEQLRQREAEQEREREALARGAEKRLREEMQKKDLYLQERLKQKEQEFALKADARVGDLQKEWAAEAKTREEEWERKAAARVREAEAKFANQAHQNDELFQAKLRQRDQQWQQKLDATRTETQAQIDEAVRRRGVDTEAALRDLEVKLRAEMKQKEEALAAAAKQREQDLTTQLNTQAEARRMASAAQWHAETEIKVRAAVEPVKALLSRAERERDEAKQASVETGRHVADLEKKLTEASSFLNSWRNGKTTVGT